MIWRKPTTFFVACIPMPKALTGAGAECAGLAERRADMRMARTKPTTPASAVLGLAAAARGEEGRGSAPFDRGRSSESSHARGPGGWTGRNGERAADLGFDGERASGKLLGRCSADLRRSRATATGGVMATRESNVIMFPQRIDP
jgi:hypothetical protein